ncbi:MAG TPA: DUF4365 domain-containing protein [Streptosporangiaceae bacterium]|nr:DUF4365 domain-containing protein [Streptosporangiaceae bacterium]
MTAVQTDVEELGWIFFRRDGGREYGVDADVEVVTESGIVTGRMLGLQIKGGQSAFRRPTRDRKGWNFPDRPEHLHYWLGHRYPMIVVLVRRDSPPVWQVVRPGTVHEAANSFTIMVPSSQRIDLACRDQLVAISREPTLIESFGTHCAVLPPSAARVVRRAAEADQVSAARLAERLASRRQQPAAIVAWLTSSLPSWLTTSVAAEDLWLATGSYAHEHGFPSESGTAFALASDVGETLSARARAIAGLALLHHDRLTARRYLDQARSAGQVLLADIGLADLQNPDGHPLPVAIPASVRNATPGALDGEPAVLTFLAGQALRKGSLLESVRLREPASAAAGPQDTALRLQFADALRRQALTHPDGASRELARALGHAQGPSRSAAGGMALVPRRWRRCSTFS